MMFHRYKKLLENYFFFAKNNKELQDTSKESNRNKLFLSKQLSFIDFYIINKSTTSHNKKTLENFGNMQYAKLPFMTKLQPTFICSKKSITNLTQHQQEESELLKADLYFSVQPDAILRSNVFITVEKIHCSLIKKVKSEESKSQVKAHLSYLSNSYFYNYQLLPRVLRNIASYETLEEILKY